MRGHTWAALPAILVAALAALAGCLGPSPSGPAAPMGGTASAPLGNVTLDVGGRDCANSILFQFLDFGAANAFLPPGYRALDPQGFLLSPAAIGQAAVVVFFLDCAHWNAGPSGWRTGFAGILVEPPAVPGAPAGANLHFYEVEHYGEALGGLLEKVGWRVAPNSTFTLQLDVPAAGDASQAVTMDDAGGRLLTLATNPAGPYTLAAGPVRLWQETANGTGYFEYRAPLEARFGTAACVVRDRTILAQLLGGWIDAPTGGVLTCPPHAPRFGAVFPGLSFEAEFRFFPGVAA